MGFAIPVWAAWATVAASAAASIYQGNRQAAALEDAAQAQGQQVNAAAGREQDAAEAEAEKIRKAGRRQAAEATAALAASGVSVDEGTPLLISQEITRGYESDALARILGADRYSRAAEREAIAGVRSARSQASAARTGGYVSALGSAASAMASSGWRSNGPGFSGTQAPAPVVNRDIRIG